MQDRWITDWEPDERFSHYTRANAGEVMPDPASPLGWTYAWEHGIALGWRDGYVRLGSYLPEELGEERPPVCGSFGGYMYINLSSVRLQAVRNPNLTVEQLDLAVFGDHPDVPPYEPHEGDERPELTEGIAAHLGWVMSATEWPELLEDRAEVDRLRAERPDLSAATDEELLARARRIQPMLRTLFDRHTITSSSSAIAPGVLAAVAEAIGDPSMPMRVLAGLGDVDSAEPSYALWELSRQVERSPELTTAFDAGHEGAIERLAASGSGDARAFLSSWDDFIARYGSRGPNEWEVMADTWETKPAIALAALDRIRLQSADQSPARRNAARSADRTAVIERVRGAVAEMPEVAGMFEAGITAGSMMGWRERTKTNTIKALHEARMVFRELGRRAEAAGHVPDHDHVFMLLDDELERFVADPSAFAGTLAERTSGYRELFDLEPPFIIADGHVGSLGQWERKGGAPPVPAAPGDVLTGVPGCPGTVTGTARVVLDASEPGALEPGDILVAPITDPAWTPLFMAAGGVVVDVGGQISHAIIVSRELGLPCVVSVKDATRRICDGATVTVDGDAGTVTIGTPERAR
jgi:pyruvate,water dikinase